MLLLACSFAYAADYLRLETNSGNDLEVYENATEKLDFYIIRQCPTPAMIMGCSNGFVVNAVGNATWDYAHPAGYTVFAEQFTVWNLGGLLLTDAISGTGMTTGSFLTGGAAMPPAGGMPVYAAEKWWFSLEFTYGDLPDGSSGDQICVDSAFFPPAGAWKFSGLTCGLGGNPDRPLFLCGPLGNDVHPCCVDVKELVCTDPDINVTPVGNLISVDICGTASFNFGAEPGMDGLDPATIAGWSVVSGIGTIDANGHYSASVAPDACGDYLVTIEVENSCGGTDTYDFTVTFVNSPPYFVGCPDNCGSEYPVGQGNDLTIPLVVDDPDACQGLTVYIAPGDVVATGDVPFLGTAYMDGMNLKVETEDTDGDIFLCITVTVEDEQGATAECEVGVEILSSEPFEVQIDKLHDVFQGHYAYVSIDMNKGSEFFGGFDFLVAYDASALTFMGAKLGWWLDGCWEYFTYRYNWNGNCGGPCPTGMLRVVGIADINNGPNHPDLNCLKHPGPSGTAYELVELTFYVTNDRTFECMYVPIRFFWHDCGDNAISNIMGDTLWISRFVYTYEMVDITGSIHYGGHYWLGDCENPDPLKPAAIPFIDFIHGGIDIICSDSIDAPGDINLNNIANEIADAVLFTNYFIYGLGVFDINPEGQIAASDVNKDGRVLTVGDLVYLVRLLTGDVLPYAKLSPFANAVDITYGDVVTTSSATGIGAALFVFDGVADVNLLADGMKMKSDVVNGQTRVLVWSDTKNHISAGDVNVLNVNGNVSLVEVEVSDYYGNLMTVNSTEKVLPSTFALKQNYPNPFNPSTDITIVLPGASEYKLDIYNVAGQLVESFSGYGVNEVTVTWNANEAASGIYFYKATAGQFSATKKMVLVK
jgi:hypothetical protein